MREEAGRMWGWAPALVAVALTVGIAIGVGAVSLRSHSSSVIIPDIDDEIAEGYTNRINDIIGRAESGEITDEQAWIQIQDVISTASRHEVPPWEWQSPPTTVIEQGSGVEAASYIIFLDSDNNCYAKSGDNGEIVFSGADAATVIQAAIDDLPTMGGKVFIKEATYVISQYINIARDNVLLEGAGAGTSLFLESGADTFVIKIGDGSTEFSNIKIRNLQIDGNKANQSTENAAIFFNVNIKRSSVEGCLIHDIYGDGIRILGTSGKPVEYLNITNNQIHDLHDAVGTEGIDANWWNYGVISGNIIRKARDIIDLDLCQTIVIANNVLAKGNVGIELQSATATITGNFIWGMDTYGIALLGSVQASVTGNFITLNRWDGIRLFGNSFCVIEGNMLWRNSYMNDNTYSEIYLLSNGATGSTYNIIKGNVILIDHATYKAKYGINENDENCNNNCIEGNIITGAVISNIRPQGSSTIVRNNIGYTTENSGTATIANGKKSITVAHGLALIPSIVTVTGTHSEVVSLWVENINSDNFDIGVTGAVSANRDVYWYAENHG